MLFEVELRSPMPVNIRIDMRACPDTMIRINGRQDNRAKFVSRNLPCYGRNRSIIVRRNDRGRWSYGLREVTITGAETGVADGTTMISVEPRISEPAASAVPTTMPSTTAIGNVTIAPAADARSVKTPGCWMTTVCCACAAVKAKRPTVRVRMIFFMVCGFLSVEGWKRNLH